ncbi:hypothetical protein B0H14DRAFT_726604 [Mycena olivaceomarginata]|nr:hypothetical protein B0H14DRAFT_726604 [Mycena olivaceomarginata]
MMTYYIPLAVVGALPLMRPVGASPLWWSALPVTVTTVTVTPVCSVPTASAIPTILTSSSVPPIVSVSSLLSSALVLPSAVVDPAVSLVSAAPPAVTSTAGAYRNLRRRHC